MQRNVEKAQERVWVSEANLCRKLEKYNYSRDREIGRPNNRNTSIRQMMQSNNTKFENLDTFAGMTRNNEVD